MGNGNYTTAFTFVFFLVACSGEESVHTPQPLTVESTQTDTVETDTLLLDTELIIPDKDYARTLEIVQECAFHPNLTGTLDDAKEWLTSEQLPFSDVYAEEEGVYKLSFVISSVEEGTQTEFNFVYNTDYMESCRHIIQNIDELRKTFFINQLEPWLISSRELSDLSAKCFRKDWGAYGTVWERQLKYGVCQTLIQRSPADYEYPWIEIREILYKDVSDDNITECP